MAKRSKHRRASSALALRPFMTPPRPIVVEQTKIVKAKKQHHTKHHRHGGMGGMLGNFASPERIGIAMGAFALGYIQKQNWNIPSIPVLGKTGTVALASHFLSDNGRNKLAADICTASLAVAAYTLANTGSIVGGEGEDADAGFVGGW